MVLKTPIFGRKAQNFVKFGPYDFVLISPACGPNTYQIRYGETLDFQCQHQQWNIKYPIGKSIFTVNLPLKLFPATVVNADIGSLKSLHTLFTSIWTTCWWNLNKIVYFKLREILSFLTKNPVSYTLGSL